eukprot:gene2407-2639_t
MDYTPEDLHNAEEKMKEAAVRYDRLMPGASPLDGFNVESLDSMEFRDTIRSVFHVKLTLPELSAYILTYHNEEKNYRVNCANFLLNFFRNGFQEKSRRLKELWKKRKDKEELLKKEKLEKEKILEKKNAMQVNFHFTEEEKENAVLKLRRAAKLYDKTTPGAMSMKAFEVKEMPPHVFKEQLRRIFNLKVTPAEMGALMSVFDVNGDGVITCEEFTKVFINMGFEEREKELKAYRQQQQLQLQKQRKLEKEVQQAKDHLNATKVAYNYTEEEWETAMFKLKEAAWRFDRTMTGAPSLEAFNQLTMTVYEFKDQLKRIFYLNTTPQELGAIMKYFDPEESGQINCSNFLKKFLRLGYEERMERKREYRLYEEQMDFQTAFGKLRAAAIKYNKDSPSAGGLNAFEAATMPPHIFKEQLKLVFHVKVTVPELFALVSFFQPDGQQQGQQQQQQQGVSQQGLEVDCSKFIITFLQMGYSERNRLIQEFRKKNKELQQQQQQGQLQGSNKQLIAGYGSDAGGGGAAAGGGGGGSIVNYTFTEDDMKTMLTKLVSICLTQTSRSGYNPNQLMTLQSIYFTPQEAKHILKSMYNIKYTPCELGAFVSYFDMYNHHSVHVQTFFNTLLSIKFKYKQFKVS